MTLGIYSITAPSGSKYIGMSAVGIEGRWKDHVKELRRGMHKCKGLQRAYEKYGLDHLIFEIIDILNEEFASTIFESEQKWWDYFHKLGINLYNGRPSGTGSVFHNEETRLKISKSLERSDALYRMEKSCKECSELFSSRKRVAIFCSLACRNKASEKFVVKKAVELYSSGQSLRQVAKTLKVSHIAIRNSLLSEGYSIRSNNPKNRLP